MPFYKKTLSLCAALEPAYVVLQSFHGPVKLELAVIETCEVV